MSLIAFTTAFKDDTAVANPDAVAWMQSKISQRFPGEAVSGLDIIWRTATYNAADRSAVDYAPLQTIHVDFGTSK